MAETTENEIEKTQAANDEAENQQPAENEPLKTELEFLKAMPDTVDAGSMITLEAEVSCEKSDPELRPAGRVIILDADGNIAAEAPLLTAEEQRRIEIEEAEALIPKNLPEGHPMLSKPTEEDLVRVLGKKDEEAERIRAKTVKFTVKVPSETGEYTWTAKYEPEEIFDEEEENPEEENPELDVDASKENSDEEAGEKKGYFNHLESSLAIPFKVRLHLVSVTAWDIPRPVISGEPFKISVGATCSCGCSMAGVALKIETENGIQTAVLGNEILAHTKATTWAEITLTAPADEALHEWTVSCEAPKSDFAHQLESAPVIFRTAPKPEHTVRVVVIEKHEKKPLEKAYIMLGMHQSETNGQGVSEVKVPAGKQILSVNLKNYNFEDIEVAVTGDMTVTAEMNFTPSF